MPQQDRDVRICARIIRSWQSADVVQRHQIWMIMDNRFSSIILPAVLICGSCTGGGNTNEQDNGKTLDDSGSLVSGTLNVVAQEDRTTFLEQEPNDNEDQLDTLTTVTVGSRIAIFGELSRELGDAVDRYHFNTDTPLAVAVILSFDFDDQVDLAIGLTDSGGESCTIDGRVFNHCHDTDQNPERPVLEADGDFTLTVSSMAGSSNYVMGLEFLKSGASKTTAATVRPDTSPHPLAEFVPSQLIVKFDAHLSPHQCEPVIAAHGLKVLQRCANGALLVQTDDDRRPAGRQARKVQTLRTCHRLRRQAGVRYAEPNGIYRTTRSPNDEFFSLQWHYNTINLPEAWDTTIGVEDVVIAVVDTGILEHPDIADRLTDGYDFISDTRTSRDGDGIDPDPTDAGDLAGGPNRSSYHGTHVSGTIAATTNNGEGVSGVTWNCRLMPVRALGVGGGTSFDIARAVLYAAQIGTPGVDPLPSRQADVINMSLASSAGSSPSQTMGDAIREAVAKGTVVVAAAGNEGSSSRAYPAGFEETIAVSAVDPQLDLAPYSNFGDHISLAAPGGNLALDLTGDGQGDGVLSIAGADVGGEVNFGFSFQHGTSMACPHVAGVAGLIKSINPTLTGDEIREILSTTARDQGDPERFGNGVIDAALAVNEAATRADLLGISEPVLSLSTNSLDFGSTLDQLFVLVTNTGVDILEITNVSVEALNGQGWLDAEIQMSSGSANVSAIIIRVNRSAQTDGRYNGRVSVLTANDQSDTVQVSMSVGQDEPISDDIFVVAINANTRESIAQDVTSADTGFRYAIPNVPAGEYFLYAGTDRDDNGQICDLGELCGAVPSVIRAETIVVTEGQTLEGIDFPVGELIFQSQSAQGDRTLEVPAIRRLD